MWRGMLGEEGGGRYVGGNGNLWKVTDVGEGRQHDDDGSGTSNISTLLKENEAV
jgi:hypothetical protein